MQTSEHDQVRLCVNLCETAPLDAGVGEFENMLAIACGKAGFPYCERVYVGSYFCENYFLGLDDAFHESVGALCARHQLGATLVIPVFGQAFLDCGNRRIADLLVRFSGLYDEVVLNDVGMFEDFARWESQAGLSFVDFLPDGFSRPDMRLGVGRLFSKERRDARYAEVFESYGRPQLSAEARACLALQAKEGVIVEVDPTNSVVDVSGLLASAAALTGVGQPGAQPSVEVAMHMPYCYATTGRNCGPASSDEPDGRKFRLGRGCAHQCLRLDQGCITDEGARYVNHGRTFYFANPACRITGAARWRIVYSAM